jgi:PAS domain S-box-containing protein
MSVATATRPTGRERFFGQEEVIVSKTDVRGVITYANRVFLRVAGYNEEELLGKPHNIIRHPDMPRCVFKLLWDKLHKREEVFAYVLNMARNGDHYWVFAHVTPSLDSSGHVVGYHSNRRVPSREAVAKAANLYKQLLAEEAKFSDRKAGMLAGEEMLMGCLGSAGISYDEFVFTL